MELHVLTEYLATWNTPATSPEERRGWLERFLQQEAERLDFTNDARIRIYSSQSLLIVGSKECYEKPFQAKLQLRPLHGGYVWFEVQKATIPEQFQRENISVQLLGAIKAEDMDKDILTRH